MRCRALCAPEPKTGRMELREYDVAAPGPGEVTVKVQATLISPGTERAFVLGLDNTNAKYPYHPGYCAAGEITAVGAGVTKVKPGDKVAARISHRSAWTVAESEITPLLPGVDVTHGVFLALGQIGIQGARRARIELGEGVLVLGLGIIGQLALQAARLAGGQPVVGVDRMKNRLDLAKACGADAVLDASDDGWKDALKKLTGGHGPQVSMEVTGVHDPIAVCCQVTRRLGRVVLLASTRAEGNFNFYRDVHHKGITVLGSHAWAVPTQESRPGTWTMREDEDVFQRLVVAGKFQLDPLITDRLTPDRAVAAYETMLKGDPSMIGSLITWD